MAPLTLLSLVSALSTAATLPTFAALLCSFPHRRRHSHFLLSLFRHLPLSLRHDPFTISSLSKSLSLSPHSSSLPSIFHSLSFRLGFLPSDPILANSLVLLYLHNLLSTHALQLFDEMPVKTISSYNTLISHFSHSNYDFVFQLVIKMQSEGYRPDGFTMSSMLPVSGFHHGREIHGFVIRNELTLGSDFHISSCLISMYCKISRVDLARHVFDQMCTRNVVNWTAMICGYVGNGDFEEALELLREMQFRESIFPNEITLITALPSVGSLVKFSEGKSIHGYSFRMGFNQDASLNNAIIDAYAKCGRLDYARKVFDGMSRYRDAISWSCMISSYGLHGKGEEAIVLFEEMCKEGFAPDSIIGLSVLSACSRAGLVDKGLEIYTCLIKDYLIAPTVEMCACIVDLLSRAGQVNRALDFIESMPVKPSPSVWGALFEASVVHDNETMQELAYNSLVGLEGQKIQNPSNLVSLSNLHASSGRWDLVEKVREKINGRKWKKLTGCSWVGLAR